MFALKLLLVAGDIETNPGPGELSDNLKVVCELLSEIPAKWNMLGIQLRINPGIIDGIQKDHKGDCSNCLMEVVKVWLKSGKACYEDLVTALKSRTVGEADLATRIEEKHCKSIVLNYYNYC